MRRVIYASLNSWQMNRRSAQEVQQQEQTDEPCYYQDNRFDDRRHRASCLRSDQAHDPDDEVGCSHHHDDIDEKPDKCRDPALVPLNAKFHRIIR